jgi:hypothetical protein
MLRYTYRAYLLLTLNSVYTAEAVVFVERKFVFAETVHVNVRTPLGGEFLLPVQTGPEDHPASSTVGTGSLSQVKAGGA